MEDFGSNVFHSHLIASVFPQQSVMIKTEISIDQIIFIFDKWLPMNDQFLVTLQLLFMKCSTERSYTPKFQ